MTSTAPDVVDLTEITEAIARTHPDVPFATIEIEVSEAAHAFSGAKVLDFLPVLIERAVRQRLGLLRAAA